MGGLRLSDMTFKFGKFSRRIMGPPQGTNASRNMALFLHGHNTHAFLHGHKINAPLDFFTTLDKACLLLDELVASLAEVGLTLNVKKTKILTTQAQPPKQLRTRGEVTVDVLDRASPHKWLGCLLHPGGYHHADVDFHLQAASRAFHANRWILTDRHVSLATRLRYFDTVITPVVCFAAGHRAIFKHDLNKVDVVFRKLLRSVVGPPAATDWSRPWHEILHDWNARVAQFVQQYSVKCWSVRCVEMHWNLAQYAANLPPDRWLSRILMWTCRGHHTVGRPRNTWDTTLQNFCRYQQLGNWRAVARDANRWANLMPQFVFFCNES